VLAHYAAHLELIKWCNAKGAETVETVAEIVAEVMPLVPLAVRKPAKEEQAPHAPLVELHAKLEKMLHGSEKVLPLFIDIDRYSAGASQEAEKIRAMLSNLIDTIGADWKVSNAE